MNLPNKLTMLRVFMVPLMALVWLFPYEQFDIYIGSISINNLSISYINIAVMIIFVLASFTDFLDGYLARKNNLVTTFGKFFDPIADKLLVDMTLIILAYKHMIPVLCCIIMILRDLIVDGCRLIASNNGVVISAGILGKLKTVLQMITIVIVLLNNFPLELIQFPLDELLIWFTSFISLASGFSYFMQVKEFIFKSM